MITQTMINDALRYIGIPKGKADEEIKEKVIHVFNELHQIVKPRIIYQRTGVAIEDDRVVLEKTHCCIVSKDLAALLAHSKNCILMAATLGLAVDRQIALRQKLNMLDAVILDACASVLIEKVCDDTEGEIISNLKEDEYLTMRFSPGYGDVPLEASGEILDILMAQKKIGLSLTNSHMLVPTKSITAIIGLSSQRENRQKSCGHCNLVKTCMYKRRGERCGV